MCSIGFSILKAKLSRNCFYLLGNALFGKFINLFNCDGDILFCGFLANDLLSNQPL